GGSVCLQSPGAFGDQRGSERRKVEVVLVFGGKQRGPADLLPSHASSSSSSRGECYLERPP
ncbi:hypothetical protein KUCAC02_031378, partial [Chaenocephalus aceratus]